MPFTLTLDEESSEKLKQLADAYGRDPVDVAQALMRDALQSAAVKPTLQSSTDKKDIMRLAGTMPHEEAEAILKKIKTLDTIDSDFWS